MKRFHCDNIAVHERYFFEGQIQNGGQGGMTQATCSNYEYVLFKRGFHWIWVQCTYNRGKNI